MVVGLPRRRRGIVEKIEWRGEVSLPGGKVEQILVNLLSNAADAVPPGKGVVEVVLRADGAELVLEVADNGPGVPAHLADRVFDAFVTTKPEGVGTGLGLAISRRLAASMGGSLTAERASLGGAVFILRLPLAPVAAPAPPARATPPVRTGRPVAAG